MKENRKKTKIETPRQTRRVNKAIYLYLMAVFMVTMGCTKSVNFNVVRPAKVNIPAIASDEGNDPIVSVERWTAADPQWEIAANEIAQWLRQAITNAPAGTVKFAESGGAVVLSGNLTEHAFSEEENKSVDTCTKVDGNGKKFQYSCTTFTRTGKASIRVAMNVINSAGVTVAAETVELSEPDESRATVATSDLRNGKATPGAPSIDWSGKLAKLRSEAAMQLAKIVVPYTAIVQKRWFKCGDANDLCDAALVQIRSSNFTQSIDLLNKAIDKLRSLPEQDTKALAAAYYSLGLAQEFSGDYDKAREAVNMAIQFNPRESVYANEIDSINSEESNAAMLASQK